MNAMASSSRTVFRERAAADAARPENPIDAAWLVLEAANDLADDATVAACRRTIDAGLAGTPASASDLLIILGYFR